MKDAKEKDLLLTAAECAARIGVTVRGLRTYEQRGLVTPRRSAVGWRLYGAREISRLHEILALKRFGLSLSRIAELLKGRAIDLDRTLALQQSALTALRERTDQSLFLVHAARTKLAVGGSLSINELMTLAKDTKMTESSLDVIAQRRYEQARPRTAVQIDPSLLDRYVGHYRFGAGGMMTITRDGDRLFERLTGQSAFEIFPESDNQFFLKVAPAQLSFVVEGGAASALVLHQNGLEQLAKRIDEAEAERFADELANRIRDNRPQTDSEATIRRTIAEHQTGQIDYDRMTEPLAAAAAARSQGAAIAADLAKKGALRNIRFAGVGQSGWDVYRAEFENGEMEWRIALTPDGRIEGLLLRSMP